MDTVDKKVDQQQTECQEISNQFWLPGGEMKDLVNYIDDLKEVCGSDYKAAKRLGVAKATISKLRTRQELSEDLAIKIAKILNIELSELLVAAEIARSEGEIKKAWERVSQMIGRAAVMIIAVGIVSTCYDLSFNDMEELNYGISLTIYSVDNIHYAKLKGFIKSTVENRNHIRHKVA